jgi:hypothetical protein
VEEFEEAVNKKGGVVNTVTLVKKTNGDRDNVETMEKKMK